MFQEDTIEDWLCWLGERECPLVAEEKMEIKNSGAWPLQKKGEDEDG